MNLTRQYICVLFIFLCVQNVFAIQEFVVEDIRVEGLQRITPGTVFSYLPIQVGETFDNKRSAGAINALFKTGFFKDINLKRDGNVLIVVLEERPAIGSITLSGNEDIASEDLIDGLRQIGFAEGQSFDRLQLEKLEQELSRQYHSLGKYSVELESTVSELDNNRVAVEIDIFEGEAAEIKRINIIGNFLYEEDELLDLFSSTEPTLLSFFTKKSQYSRQKLTADLELLRSHYLNAGYINFNIDSTQVSITPDKQGIYITINITEGELFTVSAVRVTGNFSAPEDELAKLSSVSVGDIFSRRAMTNSSEALSAYLGDDGYAFASVNTIPEINEEDHTVEVVFFVDPGKRTYVRRINFSGNTRTRDEVLRREMRQQEGSWVSTRKVERSKVRLQRLGFFGEVEVETQPVPGTTDQVDLNYSVTEVPSGNISLGFGFSQTSGFTLQTSIAQDNFLGSGKRIDFAFSNSSINRQFGLGYADPYYTLDGVSINLRAFYNDSDSADANIISFNSTVWGANVGFGIPISEYNTFRTEFSYENTEVSSVSNSGMQVRDFLAANDENQFNILRWSNSLSFDTRNKAILPDDGALHRLSVELTLPLFFGDSLKFYKLGYRAQWFKQLFADYILSLKGNIGYGGAYGGDSSIPFFENFYAGGPKSVRGYKENTLGPVDSSTNRPTGGDLRIVTSTEVIFPIPFLKDIESVRVSAFVDGGNVYGVEEDFSFSELRYSVGLGGIWVSPFGLVSASIAYPFSNKPGDQTQEFQFTFGTSF